MLASLLALAHLDREIFRIVHVDLHREWLDPLMLVITYTGDGHIQIPALLLCLAFKNIRPYAAAAIAAFCAAGILRIVVKTIVDRQRPTNLDFTDPVTWPGGLPGWFGRTFDVVPFGDNSFPSGHATTAFAIAFMVAWLLKGTDTAWLGWLLSLWATLVAFSRIYIGVHYPADILAAAALAAATTSALFLLWQAKNWLPNPQLSAKSETTTPSHQP